MAGNQTVARQQAEGRLREAQKTYDSLKNNKSATQQQKDTARAGVDAAKADLAAKQSAERSATSGCAPSLF